jgi:DNA-binding transcriptional LysR family regulator
MARPPFRLHHITLLNVVMNSQTLTEAARRLNISQPAVSKQLKQLHADLGFALFERQGHQLVPTFEARAMLDQVSRLNASLDVLNRLAGEFRSTRRGHLQIGCIPSAAVYLLPKALQAAIGGELQMLCSVHTGSTAQALELVETQQVDLAIAMKVRDTSRLNYTPLMALRLECLLPTGHALAAKRVLTPQDLAPYPVIGIELPVIVSTGVGTIAWDDALGSVRVRVDSAHVASCMAEAGLGIAVVDSLTGKGSSRRGLVRRRMEHPYEAEIGIYRPSFRPRAGMVDELMAALQAEAEGLRP